jgi:hypothetical protein
MMRILSSATEINQTLRRLIEAATSIRIAVAWATHSAPLAASLKQHEGKIEQLTVGTHFYQTDPRFLKAFLDHPALGVVPETGGVFHPKVYFFILERRRCECIVGSANFTEAGLTRNEEVAIRLSGTDLNRPSVLTGIEAVLLRYAKLGKPLNPEILEDYTAKWRSRRAAAASLSKDYRPPRGMWPTRVAQPNRDFLRKSWAEYYAWATANSAQLVERRLGILESARALFEKHESLRHMTTDACKRIAGIHETDRAWDVFGVMTRARDFRKAITTDVRGISDALDEIPLHGPVDRRCYHRYVARFVRTLRYKGIACATRLLALKRPDYFLCVDGPNRNALSHTLGIPKNLTFDTYWSKFVAPVTHSVWWTTTPPVIIKQKRLWSARVAMMDSRLYDRDWKPNVRA